MVPVPPAKDRRVALIAAGATALSLALVVAALLLKGGGQTHATSEAITMRPTPSVILAVRDLSRLEAASVHMEKVIELTDEQSRFFGLVTAKDQILLVAVGDVVAGVDMSKLADTDVQVDPTGGVRVVLPPPEVFSTAIDEGQTHVFGRTTEMLASRKEELEGLARKEAAVEIEKGALDGGILERARANATRTVRALLQSLGFPRVVVEWSGRRE
jgi:hypothetical protein